MNLISTVGAPPLVTQIEQIILAHSAKHDHHELVKKLKRIAKRHRNAITGDTRDFLLSAIPTELRDSRDAQEIRKLLTEVPSC